MLSAWVLIALITKDGRTEAVAAISGYKTQTACFGQAGQLEEMMEKKFGDVITRENYNFQCIHDSVGAK